MKFTSKQNFIKFLENLERDYKVFVPVKKGSQRFYTRLKNAGEDMVLGEVRAFEPLKAFFSRAREVVAKNFSDEIPHADDRPLAIAGVKACDLKGFKVQDYVFKDQDCKDPFYIKNRSDNLIISADCTTSIGTCFCTAVGIEPHPKGDFDINLSEVSGGYVVEIGSQKGQELVDRHKSLFQEAQDMYLKQKLDLRTRVKEEVDKNLKNYDVPSQDIYKGIIEKNFESDIWRDEAETCVECGACTNICPTCHCFLLYDQKNKEELERLRIWDSCMVKDYARVAGGANPRPKLWMRLRNRFEKKFDFFPKVAGFYACTGCGRCISACPAKIDIRKVLKRLTNASQKSV